MTAPEPKQPRRNALLEKLCAEFAVFRDHQPLALGIHKAIKEKMPEVEKGPLGNAMRIHTSTTRYLKALSQGQVRFDLEGKPSGEITDEQREAASTTLKERFKKGAERRRAEIEAEKEAKRAQEQEERKQANLLKLAQKFNNR